MDTASVDTQPFAGHEIVVAVCGGIAAYKSADLVSKLVQAGAGVTVVMTRAARRFITPLTFEALSGRIVRTGTWDTADTGDTQHIKLTERAQLLVVCPATANMLAKAAHGLCDDLVSLLINAAACPVLFAPAMNHRMWENPVTQENVATLKRHGYRFIDPTSGWLACKNVGAGRLPETPDLMRAIRESIAAAPACSL